MSEENLNDFSEDLTDEDFSLSEEDDSIIN